MILTTVNVEFRTFLDRKVPLLDGEVSYTIHLHPTLFTVSNPMNKYILRYILPHLLALKTVNQTQPKIPINIDFKHMDPLFKTPFIPEDLSNIDETLNEFMYNNYEYCDVFKRIEE